MKHLFGKDFNDRLAKAGERLAKTRDEKARLEFLEGLLNNGYHARHDAQEGVERVLDGRER